MSVAKELSPPFLNTISPLFDLVEGAEKALAQDPSVFQRSGELVYVTCNPEGQWSFRPIKPNFMGYLLSKVARWHREGNPVHPPSGVAKCIVEKGEWGHIRSIRSVVPFPPVFSNGYIPYRAGYSDQSRVFFTPGELRFRVNEKPSLDEAKHAADILLDLVSDFPFLSPAHQSAWIAALLSPLTRYAHQGNIPLCVIQANSPRVGKTTLAKILSYIVLGEECPVVAHAHSEAEERKRILSYLRAGRSIVLIDNVVGQFGGAVINALATSRSFEDRILGRSKVLQVPNDIVWLITGNNMTLAPDTSERCLNVRLHTEEENPHLRSGFRYPDVVGTARQYRDRLLSAALTIVRAYIAAGKPPIEMEAWGGFESWSRLVRGAIMWTGLEDPAKTRHQLEKEADTGKFLSSSLVEGWKQLQVEAECTQGLTSAEACDLLEQAVPAKLLRTALATMSRSARVPNVHALETLLRSVRERNFGGQRLVNVDGRWTVEELA